MTAVSDETGRDMKLTRAQFIMQMILAYARVYPGTKAKQAMPAAAKIYRDFTESEGIEFGDERYAWDANAAAVLVAEYEDVALEAALSAAPVETWKCAARKQSLPEPADCGWPTCGCDPHADKVIAALEEQGRAAPVAQEPVASVNNDRCKLDDDPSDNRLENLREATPTQNNYNRAIQRNSRSGFKGVYRRKDTGKYQACIRVDKTPLILGYFDTPEEASRAYEAAAVKYHGEFARLGCRSTPTEI